MSENQKMPPEYGNGEGAPPPTQSPQFTESSAASTTGSIYSSSVMSANTASSSMADVKANMRNAARATTPGVVMKNNGSPQASRPGAQYFASGDDRVRRKEAGASSFKNKSTPTPVPAAPAPTPAIGAHPMTAQDDTARGKSNGFQVRAVSITDATDQKKEEFSKDKDSGMTRAQAKLHQMEREDKAREERHAAALEKEREAASLTTAMFLHDKDKHMEKSKEVVGVSEVFEEDLVSPECSTIDKRVYTGKDASDGLLKESAGPPRPSEINDTIGKFTEDGLAVAVAIRDDDEDEKYFPAAVEYDPESKPPILQNRRFRLYGGMGCCILLVVVAIAIFFSLEKSKEGSRVVYVTVAPSPAPSPSPTSARDTLYRSIFAQHVGDKVFEEGTAHSMAATWIIHEDKFQLEPDADNLVQRFVLAFLYFHFTALGTQEWRSCNPPKEGETNECAFASVGRNEKQEIIYVDKPGKIRWLTDTEECTWVGVICAESPNVVGLELFGQKLTGTLPQEIEALSFLQLLSLSLNDISGTIPARYSELKHLISLELHYNQLTGTIAEGFFTRGGNPLLSLNVGANLMTGTISTNIGLLTDLKGLHIFDNQLSGTIPSEFGNLEYLAYTRWSNNTFTGTIPPEAVKFSYVAEWWFQDNGLQGTIPTEVGLMTRLTGFRTASNQLTGTIPEEIYSLPRLQLIDMTNNQHTGTLSTSVGQLQRLIQLRIAQNPLTGTIPSEIRNIEGIRLAWMHLTKFEGSLPLEICDIAGPGLLEYLQTDCFPEEDPPVPCRCCSACCNRETGLCLIND